MSLNSSYSKKNISEKRCRENQNTDFMFNNLFFTRAFDEEMWKNIVESSRPQMKKWYMHMACWIPKATNTHSDYITHIALPLQQWLHERTSLLRYTDFACLVKFASVIDISCTASHSPKCSLPLR